MKRKWKRGLMIVGLFLVAILLAVSCSSVKKMMKIENPQVKVSDVKITGLGFESIDLLFDITVENPNAIGVTLSAFEYDLLINDHSFLNGREEKKMEISANSESTVQLPLRVGYKDIYDTFQSLAGKDSSSYQLNARLFFNLPLVGSISIPVGKSGRLPLVKLPRISVEDLKIKHLGFGGADLLLRVRVDNPNAFSMAFRHVNYNLNVNGKSWVAGTIQKVISVDEKNAGIFDIPISLSFSDIGQSVIELLKGNNVLNYNLKGNFDVSASIPSMGKVNLPFNKSGQIRLKR